MSVEVTGRLRETARRGVEWRQRSLQIRCESSLLLDKVRELCKEHEERLGNARVPGIGVPVDNRDRSGTHSLESTLPSADVLAQVRHLLHEHDAREREHWTEDDTCILVHLREAWAAAGRKGYTLQDLRAILEGLSPSDLD